MKNLLKKIKENNLWMDFINLFTGLVLIVTIILFFLFPSNTIVIALMFLLTGGMNLSNGVKKYKEKGSRNMGMSLIMVSIITVFVGLFFLLAVR
ncbi:MAG: hypothetical protein RR056_07190 [Acetivibrio sp.]